MSLGVGFEVYSITHIPTAASVFFYADKMQSLFLLPDSAAMPFWPLWTALQLISLQTNPFFSQFLVIIIFYHSNGNYLIEIF